MIRFPASSIGILVPPCDKRAQRCQRTLTGLERRGAGYRRSAGQSPLDVRQIRIHHDVDQFMEADRRLPPEPLMCLAPIGAQVVDFGWPEVPWIDRDMLAPVEPRVC